MTVDHLGVGDSTVPEHPLDFAQVAAAGHAAVRAVLAQLREGTFDADLPAVPGAVASRTSRWSRSPTSPSSARRRTSRC